MTPIQKKICCDLLAQCVEHGFGSSHSLKPIAQKHGLTVKEIYDNETNTGILWDLGPHGQGLIDVRNDSATVYYETHDMLAHWSDFKGI
ncbi:hypothetical protein Ga0100231_023905 [Opitutaceae bacterium TAV4]|nr:hypothetical protein Ga0100231_023905 [Opitutaceae bacterium TAV4]RRK00757.1 hypothetical protein Ga0100230_023480 [Opitutaceae bacterium TAV3]